MAITLLRTLTEKSVLGFGDRMYKHVPISELIKTSQGKKLLTGIYYNLSNIDFTDSVLDSIGISKDYRIAKPGKNTQRRAEFLKDLISKLSIKERAIMFTKKRKAKKAWAYREIRQQERICGKSNMAFINKNLN